MGKSLFVGSSGSSRKSLNGKQEDNCVLKLHGAQYSKDSGETVPQLRRLLKKRVIDHLERSKGPALIIFDEIHKLLPGILDVSHRSLFISD